MLKSAVSVMVAAQLILCLSNCGCSSQGGPEVGKQEPAAKLDIARVADEADVIVIGGYPQESRMVNILGQAGGVTGYRIEADRFIKGANTEHVWKATDWPHAVPAIVSIELQDLSESRRRTMILPATTGEYVRFIYFLTERCASFSGRPRWVPISPDAWFVPASPETIKQVEDAIPQADAWGKPSNGLVAGIRTLKRVYLPGEPVRIELHLKNTSDHYILIPQQRLETSDYYPFLEFSGGTGITVSGDGGSVSMGRSRDIIVFLEKPVGRAEKDAMPPVHLQPGQVYTERIDLSSWQWTSTDGLQPFRPAVRLKMHGFLAVGELDKGFRYSKSDADAMWKGELEFPWFDINISSGGTGSAYHSDPPK